MPPARSLRKKLSLLALVYLLSLSANLLISSVCIMVYFRSAYQQAGRVLDQQRGVEEMRTAVRGLRRLYDNPKTGGPDRTETAELLDQLTALAQRLEPDLADSPGSTTWSRIRQMLMKVRKPHGPDSTRPAAAPEHPLGLEPEDLALLDQSLSELGNRLVQDRSARMLEAGDTQQSVVTILLINTAIGAVLCGAGLLLVRRWVIRPVEALRGATSRIASGDFAYRLQPRNADELGKLAEEVNQMSVHIVELRDRLIEHERLAAAGETVERLRDEISRPLAEVRRIVEQTIRGDGNDAEADQCHRGILEAVGRCEKWLSDLRESVSPLTPSFEPVRIRDLVEKVLAVLRPDLERHQIEARVEIDAAVDRVEVDPVHFEHAVIALVTNASEASSPGQTIRIVVRPGHSPESEWEFIVADEGTGIAPELHHKIFQPFFTTKAEGNGLGLAMAAKVIRQHGGELRLESHPGNGSRFTAVLPKQIKAPSGITKSVPSLRDVTKL